MTTTKLNHRTYTTTKRKTYGHLHSVMDQTNYISRKAISIYGTTDGCRACISVKKMGHNKIKINYNNSEECRRRIIKLMLKDPEYRDLMEKHGCNEQETLHVELVAEIQRENMQGHIRTAMHRINNLMEHQRSNLEKNLDTAMMELLIANIQVAEVYSPPRVTTIARSIGFRAGWSLDFSTPGVDVRPWDFNELEMRNRAIRRVIMINPYS